MAIIKKRGQDVIRAAFSLVARFLEGRRRQRQPRPHHDHWTTPDRLFVPIVARLLFSPYRIHSFAELWPNSSGAGCLSAPLYGFPLCAAVALTRSPCSPLLKWSR